MFLSACGTVTPETLPTRARLPTLTPTLAPSITPTLTATASITATITPTHSSTATMTRIIEASPTNTITTTPRPIPTMTATPLPETFIFGQSVQGRDLVAYRYGVGRLVIMIIGGIHAGFETNTIELVSQLQNHFLNNRSQVASDVTFIIVPSLNPDGEARGRILEGRFNGNGVDLNRNWDCGWSADAQFGQGFVDAGDTAFSEPESTALGSLIQRVQPQAVIFYHAAANGVFAGDCGDNSADSETLGELYGEASGYPYGSDFDAYPVTGTAPGWVDSIGIPALDVELASADLPEFERNLRAILAVQDWVIENNR